MVISTLRYAWVRGAPFTFALYIRHGEMMGAAFPAHLTVDAIVESLRQLRCYDEDPLTPQP